MPPHDRIDFEGIASRADLYGMVVSELGPPNSERKWCCPFHDDRRPSMNLTPDGRRYYCQSCRAHGTALDWVMSRWNIPTVVEAAKALDPSIDRDPAGRKNRPVPRPQAKVEAPPKPPRAEAWGDQDWQAAAADLVARGVEALWSPSGRKALRHLRSERMLDDHIIRIHRLGYLPDEWTRSKIVPFLGLDREGRPRPIAAPCGILIPHLAPYTEGDRSGEIRFAGVKVRGFDPVTGEPVPKELPEGSRLIRYTSFAGSEWGYGYPNTELQAGVDVVLPEGEYKALKLKQEIGHRVNVSTTGGAKIGPRPYMLDELAACPNWYSATDVDGAGIRAANSWYRWSGNRCQALVVPLPDGGKDVADAAAAGLNIVEWFQDEMIRLGRIPDPTDPLTPLVSTAVAPITKPAPYVRPYYLDEVNGWPQSRIDEWVDHVRESEGMGIAWQEAEANAFEYIVAGLDDDHRVAVVYESEAIPWFDDLPDPSRSDAYYRPMLTVGP